MAGPSASSGIDPQRRSADPKNQEHDEYFPHGRAIVPAARVIHTRSRSVTRGRSQCRDNIRKRSRALLVLARSRRATIVAQESPTYAATDARATTAPVLWQQSMNVFRRFEVPAERMYEFYGGVLGLQATVDAERRQRRRCRAFPSRSAGAQAHAARRQPQLRQRRRARGDGFAAVDVLLRRRSCAHGARSCSTGLPAPEFKDWRGERRRTALVHGSRRPARSSSTSFLARRRSSSRSIEVGLTVADLERSRAFYRSFVGLEELPPVDDERFGTRKYSYRHGATTISLRSFGKSLPADTGSGGIQYVVSDVEFVDALAKERHVSIDQPLSRLARFRSAHRLARRSGRRDELFRGDRREPRERAPRPPA